jgi:hypothetical protein
MTKKIDQGLLAAAWAELDAAQRTVNELRAQLQVSQERLYAAQETIIEMGRKRRPRVKGDGE